MLSLILKKKVYLFNIALLENIDREIDNIEIQELNEHKYNRKVCFNCIII